MQIVTGIDDNRRELDQVDGKISSKVMLDEFNADYFPISIPQLLIRYLNVIYLVIFVLLYL